MTVEAVIKRIIEFCIQPETGNEVLASWLATGVSVGSDTMSGTSVGVRPALVDDTVTTGEAIT